MRRSKWHRWVGACLTCAALAFAPGASGGTPPAVVEVAPPPPGYGTDATGLRAAAEAEVAKMGTSLARDRRRLVISLSLKSPSSAATSIVCSVNATVRDAKTGAMLAIIEADTRAAGPLSLELRKQMAYAAVRSAVRRVPNALRAN